MALAIYLSLGLCGAMAFAWAIARKPGRSGLIDVVWTYSLAGAGAFGALWPHPGAVSERQWLVAGLVMAWGLRLGTHILWRGRGGHDDPRYAELRRGWGNRADLMLLGFAQVQALASLLLVPSMILAARNPAPFGQWSDWAGALMLVVAVIGESVADAQLAGFRADPANKGKVCEAGLWSLSRHPNYFFEWLAWMAWPLIAIPPVASAGLGWLALTAPAIMYGLLVHMSGIPPLEAHMLRSRGALFADSQRRIRAFWPIPRFRKDPA